MSDEKKVDVVFTSKPSKQTKPTIHLVFGPKDMKVPPNTDTDHYAIISDGLCVYDKDGKFLGIRDKKKLMGRRAGTKIISDIPQGRKPNLESTKRPPQEDKETNPELVKPTSKKDKKKIGRPKRVLTEEQIDKINQMLDNGKPIIHISRELNIHHAFIRPLAAEHFQRHQALLDEIDNA